ncbi:hypothetical protein H5407_13265 [Mitsuaria sp. WAJ17]|uniref:DUF6265 family protein n=1 Tax=Mitsuaria sp. WAJ17 TaxID=2761452 RepID=UPI00160342C4|nr:DUF6265 family protein [Mitsuaria sp. WAJ17]MBB2486186.1 hypothetical protein [Mitsuaria sp. WAJ17]
MPSSRIRPIPPAALALAAACAALPARAQSVDGMAWLAGCWRGHFGEAGTMEQWLPPAGGTMLAMSRTVRQGKTVEFEFLQLRQLQDGTLALMPQPAGRPATVFRLLSAGPQEAVFENPAHDFPQRIAYTRSDESRLLVSIEGLRNGTTRRIEFTFSRVGCEDELQPR